MLTFISSKNVLNKGEKQQFSLEPHCVYYKRITFTAVTYRVYVIHTPILQKKYIYT